MSRFANLASPISLHQSLKRIVITSFVTFAPLLTALSPVVNYEGNPVKNGTTSLTSYSSSAYLKTLTGPTPSGILNNRFGGISNNLVPGTNFIPFFSAGGTSDQATGIALDAQGNILMAGFSNDALGNSHFAVARFLPSGQLDTTFGLVGTSKAGTVYIPFFIAGGTNDQAQALIVDAQGNILLTGFSNDAFGNPHFAVARFLPSGYLDTTFGQRGTAKAGTQYISFTIAGGTGDQSNEMIIDASDNIILGGLSGGNENHFAMARFLPSGQLDTTFGLVGTTKAGTQFIPFFIAGGTNDISGSIATDTAGNIVLGGFTNDNAGNAHFAVSRFSSSGQLDITFGLVETTKAGTQYLPFFIAGGSHDQGVTLVINPQGNILLGGWSNDDVGHSHFAVSEFFSSQSYPPGSGLY